LVPIQLYIALAILVRGIQNASVSNIVYAKVDLNIFTSTTITFFAFTAHVRSPFNALLATAGPHRTALAAAVVFGLTSGRPVAMLSLPAAVLCCLSTSYLIVLCFGVWHR
jgi:hypothetical protein